LGLFSALVGTIAAVFQTNLRAFLAYSSMGHTGLILSSFTTESALGVDTAILYFITYVFAMSGVYLVLATSEGTGLDLHATGQLRELRHNFSLSVCFSVFLLTLAGFPPLMGFFVKVGLLINLASIGQI
jgi:NADH-quinone oxidoreductase subunit N